MKKNEDLSSYLSVFSAWALAFGSSVGWGAFVMPGTTFLPLAGPVGTSVGIAIGAFIMLIIGINYSYLMNRHPDAGGSLTYTIEALGYDHGFLSAWFLILVYITVLWANATALTLIARNLYGSLFQFGFHYNILDYDVYFGEVLLTEIAIAFFGFLCMKGKVISGLLQTFLAIILILGILFCFAAVIAKGSGINNIFSPTFSPLSNNPIKQISSIVVLAPWAFVGFESISNSTAEFKFTVRKTLSVFIVVLLTAAISYILLSLIPVLLYPDEYNNWAAYINKVPALSGLKALPTFYAVHSAMGSSGLTILDITVLAGIITGLIGNFIAASRLLYSVAKTDILPEWFAKTNKNGSPENAILFLTVISLIIPFLGRTAISWIVDITTVGATIAYGYTSADALILAKRDGNRRIKHCGLAGIIISIAFFLYFMALSTGTMSTESYLLLAAWGLIGFVCFLFVFKRDNKSRFGKSTVVWIGLLFLIFFTSLMWTRHGTHEVVENTVNTISEYYENSGISHENAQTFLTAQKDAVDLIIIKDTIIQLILILAGLGVMFCVYSIMSTREKEMEAEKIKAEESNKAKTVFLSNMSHDIRTPMNAIIGYINLARRKENGEKELREYLKKISTSSHHLLALINDVLEMSRIESGKMDLEPIEVNLKETLNEVRDMFSTQMEEKDIEFIVNTSNIKNCYVMCDKNRLNRVLLNLLSNAYKFTPEGGTVSVNVWQSGDISDGTALYELRVRDSGIGMTKEFAAKVFEAFEREQNSTVSGIEGTGLGMAITKSIIDLMGGTIEVTTAPQAGTEFIIRIRLALSGRENSNQHNLTEEKTSTDKKTVVDFNGMRLLLTEDVEINREIAVMLLSDMGFEVETAINGKDAVEKLSASSPGYYDAILMDIQMPVMDGYEASRAIRALPDKALAGIPIVAMTANAFSEDVKQALDAGMNAHIAKPIDVNVIRQTLTEVL